MAAGQEKKSPLKDPDVEVRAEPDYDDPDVDLDWDYVEKVEKNVKEDVRRALDSAEDDGAGAQIGAANDAVDEASTKVDPHKIDKIHVEIDDEEGRHVEIVKKASGQDR